MLWEQGRVGAGPPMAVRLCKGSITHTAHGEAESCHLTPLVHSDLTKAQPGTSWRCPDGLYSLAPGGPFPFPGEVETWRFGGALLPC